MKFKKFLLTAVVVVAVSFGFTGCGAVSLDTIKSNKTTEITDYTNNYNQDNYGAAEYAEILRIANEAIQAIESAEDEQAILDIIADAKKDIDAAGLNDILRVAKRVSVEFITEEATNKLVNQVIETAELNEVFTYNEVLEIAKRIEGFNKTLAVLVDNYTGVVQLSNTDKALLESQFTFKDYIDVNFALSEDTLYQIITLALSIYQSNEYIDEIDEEELADLFTAENLAIFNAKIAELRIAIASGTAEEIEAIFEEIDDLETLESVEDYIDAQVDGALTNEYIENAYAMEDALEVIALKDAYLADLQEVNTLAAAKALTEAYNEDLEAYETMGAKAERLNAEAKVVAFNEAKAGFEETLSAIALEIADLDAYYTNTINNFIALARIDFALATEVVEIESIIEDLSNTVTEIIEDADALTAAIEEIIETIDYTINYMGDMIRVEYLAADYEALINNITNASNDLAEVSNPDEFNAFIESLNEEYDANLDIDAEDIIGDDISDVMDYLFESVFLSVPTYAERLDALQKDIAKTIDEEMGSENEENVGNDLMLITADDIEDYYNNNGNPEDDVTSETAAQRLNSIPAPDANLLDAINGEEYETVFGFNKAVEIANELYEEVANTFATIYGYGVEDIFAFLSESNNMFKFDISNNDSFFNTHPEYKAFIETILEDKDAYTELTTTLNDLVEEFVTNVNAILTPEQDVVVFYNNILDTFDTFFVEEDYIAEDVAHIEAIVEEIQWVMEVYINNPVDEFSAVQKYIMLVQIYEELFETVATTPTEQDLIDVAYEELGRFLFTALNEKVQNDSSLVNYVNQTRTSAKAATTLEGIEAIVEAAKKYINENYFTQEELNELEDARESALILLEGFIGEIFEAIEEFDITNTEDVANLESGFFKTTDIIMIDSVEVEVEFDYLDKAITLIANTIESIQNAKSIEAIEEIISTQEFNLVGSFAEAFVGLESGFEYAVEQVETVYDAIDLTLYTPESQENILEAKAYFDELIEEVEGLDKYSSSLIYDGILDYYVLFATMEGFDTIADVEENKAEATEIIEIYVGMTDGLDEAIVNEAKRLQDIFIMLLSDAEEMDDVVNTFMYVIEEFEELIESDIEYFRAFIKTQYDYFMTELALGEEVLEDTLELYGEIEQLTIIRELAVLDNIMLDVEEATSIEELEEAGDDFNESANIISDLNTLAEQAEEELENAKSNAKSEASALYNEGAIKVKFDASIDALQDEFDELIANIDAATTVAEIGVYNSANELTAGLLFGFKQYVDGLTDEASAFALAEAKKIAIEAISNYDEEAYLATSITAIEALITASTTAVNAATTVDGVNGVISEFLTDIAEVETKDAFDYNAQAKLEIIMNYRDAKNGDLTEVNQIKLDTLIERAINFIRTTTTDTIAKFNTAFASYESEYATLYKSVAKSKLTFIKSDFLTEKLDIITKGTPAEGETPAVPSYIKVATDAIDAATTYELADAAVVAFNTSVNALQKAVEYRTAAINELTYTAENYFEEQVATIDALIVAATTEINKATSEAAIDTIVEEFEEDLDAVKTKDEIRTDAKAATVYTAGNYLTDMVSVLADAKTTADAAIDAALTATAVAEAVDAFEVVFNDTPTAAAYRADAIEKLIFVVTDYLTDMVEPITTAKTNATNTINAVTTVTKTDIDAAVSDFEAALAAVDTAAEYKADANTAIDDVVVTDYLTDDVETVKTTATTAITAATTKTAVDTARDTYITAIGELQTAAAAKTAAIAELTYNADLYGDEEEAAIEALKTTATEAINAATTRAAIEAAVTTFETELAKIATLPV